MAAVVATTVAVNQASGQQPVQAARSAQQSTRGSRRGQTRETKSLAPAINLHESVVPAVCDEELPCEHRSALRRRAAFVLIPGVHRRQWRREAQPKPEAGDICCCDDPPLRGRRKKGQVPLQAGCSKSAGKAGADGVEEAEDAVGASMLGSVKGIRKRVPGPLGMGLWRADSEAGGASSPSCDGESREMAFAKITGIRTRGVSAAASSMP